METGQKLRITFSVSYSFPQGIYFRWHNLAIGLQQLRHQVTVHAIGPAHRLPKLSVVAFETTSVGRELLSQLSTLNKVTDRIQIRGFCYPDSLALCLEQAHL